MVTSPGTKPTATPEAVYAPKPGRRTRRSLYFRNPYLAKRRGPSARTIFFFFAVVALLIIADGIYVAIKIQAPLSETGRLLDSGVASLQNGEVAPGRAAFEEAMAQAQTAEELSARPSLFLASHIPWFSRDADAVRALARSARLVATAGVQAADAIEVLGGTSREEIAAALYSEGRLQFETTDQAQSALAGVSEDLTEARSVLEGAPYPRIDRLAAALETARSQVIDIQPRAVTVARLLDTIPRMMGRDGPRRYFVALQNQGEARATGGLIGLYGVMEANQGRVRLTHVGSSFELATGIQKPLATGILLPSWYAERYGDEVDFANVNRSPSFPLVAKTILQMYRNATGIELDGVWSFDPLAFEDVTTATGPLRGPGFNVDLGPENAADVLLRDSYLHFGQETEAQTQFLIGIIQDLYAKLGSGQVDTPALFDALADAAQGSHFKVYSKTGDEQETLRDLGLDGDLETEGPARQMVFHNNLEGNKVDSFLLRTIRSRINLDIDGSADITTTIELDNGAPSGPPSTLLGFPERGERVGYNQMELNFVLPRAAREVTATIDGQAVSVSLGSEGEFPHTAFVLGIAPDATREVSITYSVPKLQRFRQGGRDFRFILDPQPTANADLYEVEVVAPDSYGLLRPSGERTQPAGRLTYRGLLDAPVTIRANVVRR